MLDYNKIEIPRQSNIIIIVKKDDTLILEKRTCKREDLPDKLQTLLESSPEKTVHIQADKSVRKDFVSGNYNSICVFVQP